MSWEAAAQEDPSLSAMASLSPQNHVVPTAWQDEALARDGVSREVPCSALKGETGAPSLPTRGQSCCGGSAPRLPPRRPLTGQLSLAGYQPEPRQQA